MVQYLQCLYYTCGLYILPTTNCSAAALVTHMTKVVKVFMMLCTKRIAIRNTICYNHSGACYLGSIKGSYYKHG